jgi:hypothetical protein
VATDLSVKHGEGDGARLGIDQLTVTPDPVRIATEGALWGAISPVSYESVRGWDIRLGRQFSPLSSGVARSPGINGIWTECSPGSEASCIISVA